MFVPLYILLILYLVGVGIFILWAAFNVWHLMKFGFFDFVGKMHLFVFVVFSLLIIVFTLLLLWNTPWYDSFNLLDIPRQLLPSIQSPQLPTL